MSLADLARLNRNLIQSAVFAQTDEGAGDALAGFTADPVIVESPEEAQDQASSYSSALPFEYRQVIDWIKTNVFGGDVPTGMSTFITAFAAGWGEKMFEESGGSEGGGAWPSLNDLLSNPEFQNGATWLPYIRARLPSVFTTDGDDGTMLLARSDPLTGVTFVEVAPPTPLAEAIRTDQSAEVTRGPGGEIRMGGSQQSQRDPADRKFESGAPPGMQEVELDPADRKFAGGSPTATVAAPPPQTVQDLLKENPELKQMGQSGIGVTHIPGDQFVDILQGAGPSGGGRGRRGGGGGGGARRELVFDKAHLLSQVTELYEGWMLEEADPDQIEGIVDGYIKEARGFWAKDGGQLDFDTAIRSALKDLPQFKLRYRKMPGWMEPEQYLAQFHGPIAQLGLRVDTTRQQTVAAMTSGGSPTEQLRRVGRTREAQQARPFSQQLAATIAGLGAGARF